MSNNLDLFDLEDFIWVFVPLIFPGSVTKPHPLLTFDYLLHWLFDDSSPRFQYWTWSLNNKPEWWSHKQESHHRSTMLKIYWTIVDKVWFNWYYNGERLCTLFVILRINEYCSGTFLSLVISVFKMTQHFIKFIIYISVLPTFQNSRFFSDVNVRECLRPDWVFILYVFR